MFDEFFAEIASADLVVFGPASAVFEVEPGLGLIARGNPDIVASVLGAGFHDGVVSINEGGADLAGFLHDFESGFVVEPIALEREEVFLFAFCAHMQEGVEGEKEIGRERTQRGSQRRDFNHG